MVVGMDMKKIMFMAVGLLLTACSSQTQEGGESVVETANISVTETYEQVVADYQKAAQTSLAEVNNPLLNSVSLEAARAYTGEGELDIVSKTIDLNYDGQEELLIGTLTPSTDGDIRIYTGAYGQIDGEVVDLLETILPADSDAFLTFYTNNRLKIDYVTSGAGLGNAVYELTNQGFKELLRLEADLSADLDETGNYPIKDGQGNIHQIDEVKKLVTEALGHDWDQEVVD